MKFQITAESLREILNYDTETGVFTWNTTGAGRRNDKAGTADVNGYERITINGKRYYSHRLAWLWIYGEWPAEIDHVDGDGLNNRLANLRKATHAENMRNRRLNINSKSGVTGVSFNGKKNKWSAYIQIEGKTVHLGRFKEKEHAISARRFAEKELFGEFSRQLI